MNINKHLRSGLNHKYRNILIFFAVLALVLSLSWPNNISYGQQDEEIQDGVIPESVLESYPQMDRRLIGAPIKKTDVSAALVAYARAVQNVNNLEFESKTLTDSKQFLTPELERAKKLYEARNQEYKEVTEAFGLIIRAKYQDAANGRHQENSRDESDEKRIAHQSSKASESIIIWKDKAQDRRDYSKKYYDSVKERIEQVDLRIEEIQQELSGAKKAVEGRSNVVRSGIPVAVIPGLDIPVLSMDAYLRAERTMAVEQPQCGIKWWSLAAIGRAESNHGRYGGATFTHDGTVTPPIIGVPLNGNGVMAIADTDGGVFDGDTEWDRAVGPMQFIPGTWKRWGADGNHDGTINPQNIYDAALAAAKYLCSSADMNTEDGRERAYMRYNRSRAYVNFLVARGYEYNEMTNNRYDLIQPEN